MVPKQLGDELRRDHADGPLEGKIVSVQPAGSPARSLRSLLNRRLDEIARPGGAGEARPWPAGTRLAFMLVAGLAAWAIVLGAAWLVSKIIF